MSSVKAIRGDVPDHTNGWLTIHRPPSAIRAVAIPLSLYVGSGSRITLVVVTVVVTVVALSPEPHAASAHAAQPTMSRRNVTDSSSRRAASILDLVSIFAVVLLVAAVAVVVAAEWPRIAGRSGLGRRPRRERSRRRSHLRVVQSDSDDFARAVERDLANLPTIDPRERKKN